MRHKQCEAFRCKAPGTARVIMDGETFMRICPWHARAFQHDLLDPAERLGTDPNPHKAPQEYADGVEDANIIAFERKPTTVKK